MTPHRLAKPQHKHTRKSFWRTISERSIAVLLKRAHANERSNDTCAATDAAGFRSCGHVRFGSLADICSAKGHVRFAPNSDRESGFPQTVMSALPPKADMCSANGDVRFVPIADIVLSRDSTYSFEVFDGYQAFRGSTLLLFESTVPTSLTQRLCPRRR